MAAELRGRPNRHAALFAEEPARPGRVTRIEVAARPSDPCAPFRLGLLKPRSVHSLIGGPPGAVKRPHSWVVSPHSRGEPEPTLRTAVSRPRLQHSAPSALTGDRGMDVPEPALILHSDLIHVHRSVAVLSQSGSRSLAPAVPTLVSVPGGPRSFSCRPTVPWLPAGRHEDPDPRVVGEMATHPGAQGQDDSATRPAVGVADSPDRAVMADDPALDGG
jgi:hypothetical protein